jgi:hypothetical protein
MNKNTYMLLTNIFLFSLMNGSGQENKSLNSINENDKQPILFKRTNLNDDIKNLVCDFEDLGTHMLSFCGGGVAFPSSMWNVAGIIHTLDKGTFSNGGIFASMVTSLNLLSCGISIKRQTDSWKKTSRILTFIRNLTKDNQNQTFLTAENANHLQAEIMKKINDEHGKKNIGKILFNNIPLVTSSLSFLTSLLAPEFNNLIGLTLTVNNMMMPMGLLLFYAVAAGVDILRHTCDQKYKIQQFEKNLEYLLQQYQMNGTV